MSKQQFFISIDSQQVKVTKDVYLSYYRSKRRERYYEHDIKIERAVYDEAGNISGYTPPKEDSFERLIESGTEFPAGQKSVETTVIDKIMVDHLHKALDKLSVPERELIDALYFQGLTERDYTAISGIPQQTINDRKTRALMKLRKILKN